MIIMFHNNTEKKQKQVGNHSPVAMRKTDSLGFEFRTLGINSVTLVHSAKQSASAASTQIRQNKDVISNDYQEFLRKKPSFSEIMTFVETQAQRIVAEKIKEQSKGD